MTTQQKNNLSSYFTIANFVLILGFVWHQAQWQKSIDGKIEVLEEHTKNEIIHPSVESRIKLFVPRVELDGRLNNLQYSLDKIEKKLDRIKI